MKNNTKKNVPEKKNGNSSKIIIVVAAVIAVAAIILLAVFVIKPAIEKRKNEGTKNTTSVSGTKPVSDENMSEYKGCKMPSYLADILNGAQADSESACKTYGTAMNFGDYKMSRPEFEFLYYHKTTDKLSDVLSTIQQQGSNLTGFDPAVAPSDQINRSVKKNWNEKFTDDITDEYERLLYLFNSAIDEKYIPDADALAYLKKEYDYFIDAAKESKNTDEFISKTYGEGFTFDMFMRNEILTVYSDSYELKLKEDASASISQNKINSVLKQSPEKYKNVTVLIYPLAKPDNYAEAEKVSDMQSFLALARKDYGVEELSADDLRFNQVLYSDISSYFGETVAQWIFSDERKPGEFGTVQGYIYNCLVYMEELPEFTNSADILIWGYAQSGMMSADDAYINVNNAYEELKKQGITEKSFTERFSSDTHECRNTVYAGEFEYELDKWIHSPERKYGDNICYKGEEASYIVFFLKNNPDDTMAAKKIKYDLSENEIADLLTKGKNKYKPKLFDDVISDAVKSADKRYLEYYKKIEEAQTKNK